MSGVYLIIYSVFALAAISGLLLDLSLGSRPDLLNAIKYSDFVARPPSAWEQYGWSIAGFSIVLFLQAFLLLLLFERRLAVAAQQPHQFVSESVTVTPRISHGEMFSSIERDLEQSLSTILINTETAEIILKGAAPSITELQDIIADIKRNDILAVEIIDRVRNIIRLTPPPARSDGRSDSFPSGVPQITSP